MTKELNIKRVASQSVSQRQLCTLSFSMFLLLPSLVLAAGDKSKGNNLEAILPVAIGDSWNSAMEKARTLGSDCQTHEAGDLYRLFCGVNLNLDFVQTDQLSIDSSGGESVTTIRLAGNCSREHCPSILRNALRSLSDPWKAKIVVNNFNLKEIQGQVHGDRQINIVCNKLSGFKLQINDAWLALPTGNSGFNTSTAGVVVLGAMSNLIAAGRVLNVRQDERTEALTALRQVERGLKVAEMEAGQLSERSRDAFRRFKKVVTNPDWYESKYRAQLSQSR